MNVFNKIAYGITFVIGKAFYLLGFVIGKILYILAMTWACLSLIPLLIGGLMFDILLRLLGVEKNYLMITNIGLYMETLSVYFKIKKNKNETSGDKK